MNTNQPQESNIENDRLYAAMSYVWAASVYTFFFKRQSPFIQHHARQGFALFILEVVSPLTLFLMPFVVFVCIVASLVGIVAALQGRFWVLPVIGTWLKKQKV